MVSLFIDTALSAPPSYSPTQLPTNTLAPTPTRAPTNTAFPTASWTAITLPDQPNTIGGGYSYVAINNGGTFVVALPTEGPAAYYSIDTVTGIGQVQSLGNSYDYWSSISMNYDGSIVCYIQGGYLMYSLDMTMNLQQGKVLNNNFQAYSDVAISGDGTTVIVAGGSYMIGDPIAIYIRPNTSAPFNPVLVPVLALSSYPGVAYLAGVAASYDGQTLSVLLTTSILYLSTDQGATWNFQSPITVPTSPCSYWFMSAYYNGSDMIALNGNDDYGIQSTNTGKSWKSLKELPKTTLYTIAGSDSGEYLVLSTYDGIYLSSNAGANWTYSSPIGQGANNRGIVASDPTGMYVAAVTTTTNQLYLYTVPNIPTPTPSSAPTFTPTLSMAPSFTPTFVPTTSTPSVLPTVEIEQYIFLQSFAQFHTMFETMASDNSGLVAAAATSQSVYITLNSGYSWFSSSTPAFEGFFISKTLVSGNAMYIYAISGSIYVTSNTSSYTQWQLLSTTSNSYIFEAAISYTGQYIIAITDGGVALQLSSNFGESFTTLPVIPGVSISGNPINSVAMDNTGAYITIITTNGDIYLSTDYGQTFTISTGSPTAIKGMYEYFAITTSTSLQNQYQYLFISNQPSNIYISTDSGIYWNMVSVNPNASAVINSVITTDCSSNGQYVVMAYNNYVYYSSNYGQEFEIIFTYPAGSQVDMTGIAVNDNGDTIFVATTDGILMYHAQGGNSFQPSPMPSFAPTAQYSTITLPSQQNAPGYGPFAMSSNAQYITILPTSFSDGGYPVFYTASTGNSVLGSVYTAGGTVCMSTNGMYQLLILEEIPYYTNDYTFQLQQATFSLNSNYSSIEIQTTLCSMTGSGNVVIIANSYPYKFSQLYIYKQTPGTQFTPNFTAIASFPFVSQSNTVTTSLISIEIDNTGEIIAAITVTGVLYLSMNQGNTWTTISPSTSQVPVNINSFAMSQTTNNQGMLDMFSLSSNPTSYAEVVGYSNNTGSKWYSTTNGWPEYNAPWINIDCSSSGQYLIAASGDGVYFSSNTALDWEMIYPPTYTSSILVGIDPTGMYSAISQSNSYQLIIFSTKNQSSKFNMIQYSFCVF